MNKIDILIKITDHRESAFLNDDRITTSATTVERTGVEIYPETNEPREMFEALFNTLRIYGYSDPTIMRILEDYLEEKKEDFKGDAEYFLEGNEEND